VGERGTAGKNKEKFVRRGTYFRKPGVKGG